MSLTLASVRDRATITPAELAELLDMDTDSVLKALRNGELPGIKIGRLWKIPVPKVLALLGDE